MLGPSGCGKTTTLRMIAGFEEPDRRARSSSRAKDVTCTPPPKRNVNMVFQDYALFPHMTVADNVAFGLKLKQRRTRARCTARVAEMLTSMRLEGFEDRRPAQLSGGQRSGSRSPARSSTARPRSCSTSRSARST